MMLIDRPHRPYVIGTFVLLLAPVVVAWLLLRGKPGPVDAIPVAPAGYNASPNQPAEAAGKSKSNPAGPEGPPDARLGGRAYD